MKKTIGILSLAAVASMLVSSPVFAGSGHDLKPCDERHGIEWVNCIQDQLHSPDSRHGGVGGPSGGTGGGPGDGGSSGGSSGGGSEGGSGGGSGSSN